MSQPVASGRISKSVFQLVCVCVGMLVGQQGFAEDLGQIFSRVNEFVAQKNYPKALEELQWARKEIEKLNNQSLTSFLPDSVNGFVGGKPEVNSALGFTNISREYTKGDSQIKIEIQGSSGGSAGGLGGLAALGKMAAMFGGEAGQETVRIQGRTATVADSEISIFLDSGAILRIAAQGSGTSMTDLRAVADALKLSDIDGYMRGQ